MLEPAEIINLNFKPKAPKSGSGAKDSIPSSEEGGRGSGLGEGRVDEEMKEFMGEGFSDGTMVVGKGSWEDWWGVGGRIVQIT